ncbi:MAG: tRNA (5-methylaminomethyl-2-thiouridine)(34)-methyltransferase MnmD [Paracoccaceae bacterium]|nr:tRNA (5-methylaminomethyl-2-thiouridine)(34)-methyltransferase MnmD [Paracoccaceae bacterium]
MGLGDDTSTGQPGVTWRGGVPVSEAFDDPYYSFDDGLAETVHVFLAGNGLPARFAPGFHIAELGFGTGLSCLAALSAWRVAGVTGPLRFTSFEAYPLPPDAIARALAAFSGLGDLGAGLAARLAGDDTALPDLDLDLIEGDARTTLPDWEGAADAWFLDGFAPAKNPELWEPGLMGEIARHTRPGGSFATYTAAGAVRRALEAAGFAVERAPGFGRKRHMSRGRLR